jgi:HEAT repeat protein
MSMHLLRAACGVLIAAAACAQPFDRTVRDLKSKNPPNAKLDLTITGARFHQGELLPVKVQFWRPGDEGRDRMWTEGGYLLDPPDRCGDLSRPCYLMDPGGLRGGDGSVTETELNRFLPALKPGRYRVAALRTLQVLKERNAASATYGYSEPHQYVISNVVEFQVVASTPEWVRQTIDASVKALNTPIDPSGYRDYGVRERAARQLRFLRQPAAWEASLDQLDRSEPQLLAGLREAPDQPAVCNLMRRRLEDAKQYVSYSYLMTLAGACAKMESPPAPTANADIPEWARKTQAIEQRMRDNAAGELAAHLAGRTGETREQAVSALLDHARLRSMNETYRPEWLPKVRKGALESLRTARLRREREYLTGDWELLRGPDAVPALEALLDLPTPPNAYDGAEIWRLAVKRLHDIDPVKARARILAEISNPRMRLDESTVALLPPGTASDHTDELIQVLARAQGPGGGDWHQTMALLARYGSPDALRRIQAIYESQTERCQPELLAYFVRVDPAYATQILRQPAPDRCTLRYFAVTARLSMNPALEKFIAGYLTSPNVDLKMRAAEALGKYGSPAAAAPLWDTLRYFHDYWKDRPGQIADHPENEHLEVALRNSVARAHNWLTRDTGLRTIASLCITNRCAAETENDLAVWQRPLEIEVWLNAPEDFRGSVAQYAGLQSIEEMEAKLAQFPAGARLRLRIQGPGHEAVTERLRQFAAKRSLMLAD